MFQHRTFQALLLLFSPVWCQRLQEAHANICSISDTQVNCLFPFFFFPSVHAYEAAFLSVCQSCYLPEELLEQSEMTNGAVG